MVNGTQNNTAATGGQAQMGSPMQAPAGASTADPTGAGGGNIGTGNVPLPGEAGFSAKTSDPTTGNKTQ